MPDAKSDEAAAMRDVAWTAQAFLGGTADKASLALTVRTWQAAREKLSKKAFRSRPSGDATSGGAVASHRRDAKHPPGNPGTSVDTETRGEEAAPQNKATENPERSDGPKGKSTWLTPYGEAWKVRWPRSIPPWGAMARWLKPLIDENGDAMVLAHWKNFLRASEIKFVSVPRFANTFGGWDTDEPDAWRKDPTYRRPDETQDQYIQRLSYL